MARVLTKIRIDECSAVDAGAGEGCVVKLIKRDGEPASFASREEALQAAADSYLSKQLAKSATRPSGERAQYLERLFAKRTTPVDDGPPSAPLNKAFVKLQSLAKRAAEADPSKSLEQHFANLAEQKPALFAKAVRITIENDDEEPDEDDEDDADSLGDDADELDYPELDPRDAVDDSPTAIGAAPQFMGASGNGRGKTDAPWLSGGGGNARQVAPPAQVGPLEGSYDPARTGSKARPSPLALPRPKARSTRASAEPTRPPRSGDVS
jgi:hypothetical protein